MSMFYTLHRSLKWGSRILVIALLAWLWTQRAALEPVLVWYEVYKNGGIDQANALPELEGRGTRVVDGNSFEMRAAGGAYYIVRLTGFEPVVPTSSREALEFERKRVRALRELIQSNWIHVAVSYSNQNSLLGVAETQRTNINLYFLSNGLARLKGDYIKTLPRQQQYEFFRARRQFERQQENSSIPEGQ